MEFQKIQLSKKAETDTHVDKLATIIPPAD